VNNAINRLGIKLLRCALMLACWVMCQYALNKNIFKITN